MDRIVTPVVTSALNDGQPSSSLDEDHSAGDMQVSQVVDDPPRFRNTSRNAFNSTAVSARGIPSNFTATATAAATTTITITEEEEQLSTGAAPEVLTLTLRPRPSVRWDENVIDNEGMSRKSSKRCCIFHKQREFGESSTDSSDQDDNDGDNDSSGEGNGEDSGAKPSGRRIARPKKGGAVPDYQRYHA